MKRNGAVLLTYRILIFSLEFVMQSNLFVLKILCSTCKSILDTSPVCPYNVKYCLPWDEVSQYCLVRLLRRMQIWKHYYHNGPTRLRYFVTGMLRNSQADTSDWRKFKFPHFCSAYTFSLLILVFVKIHLLDIYMHHIHVFIHMHVNAESLLYHGWNTFLLSASLIFFSSSDH